MRSLWGLDIVKLDWNNSIFPSGLKLLTNPPQTLFAVGNLKLLGAEGIAVVGSRNMTAYGTWGINKFIPGIVKAGLIVISGLAYGIDAAAQQKALLEKGKVVAVLAGGLDSLYPAQHYGLSKTILKNEGLIISEYPPGTRARKHQFLARNRLIAGLARLTFVLEAGPKSGALVTARSALEQGKEVVVLPGDLNRDNSKGIAKLINEGARVALDANELVQLLDYRLDLKLVQEIRPPLTGPLANLYACLLQGPATGDELLMLLDYPIPTLQSLLTVLELDGYIVQTEAKWHVIS